MTKSYDSPCKDCQERYLGCHSKCEKYIKYHEANLERQKKIQELHEMNNDFYDNRMRNVRYRLKVGHKRFTRS